MGLLSRLFSSLKVENKIDGRQVFQFYDGTSHYHAWSTNGNEAYVWPLVKKATLSEDRNRQDLELTDGNIFIFTSIDINTMSLDEMAKRVEVYFNHNIIATFHTVLKYEGYELSKVDFVKDGEWQQYIREFLPWKVRRDDQTQRELDEKYAAKRQEEMNKKIERI